jgi:NitT/TauT family transport system ATP-binding protein
MKTKVEINNLNYYYQSEFKVLDNFNLEIFEGELVCLLGPSGCGKSTLINLLAGFIKKQSGTIISPKKKSVVFQKHNLFPWKTALKNITLGLEAQGNNSINAHQMAMEYLNRVGLKGHENKYPHQLSLGMQQRVGLARAFFLGSELLLMDEPFAALDAQTRYKMQQLLLEIRNNENVSILFVTHDIDEALLLADRIIVLSTNPARTLIEIKIPQNLVRNSHFLTTPIPIEARQTILSKLF